MNYLLGVLAAALLGTGFVLQQAVAEQTPAGDFMRARLLLDLLHHRRWLAGVATQVAGQLLSAWVIGHVVLSVAEPLLTANLLFALTLAWPLAGQRLTKTEAAGTVLLVSGVAALSLARTVHSASVTLGTRANWPIAVGGVALVAAAFAAAGRRQRGTTRATLTGVSAGLAFGLQDALTRRTVQSLTGGHLLALLTNWPGYALAGVGLIAMWLMESAFNAGPLPASLPAITAGEPLTGIVLGIVVFGDRLHTAPGLIALQVAGFAALVIGVVMMTRGPALAAVRAPRPHGRRAATQVRAWPAPPQSPNEPGEKTRAQ